MGVSRLTKVIAGVLFVLAAIGVPALGPVTLIPLGLAVWVLGEAA